MKKCITALKLDAKPKGMQRDGDKSEASHSEGQVVLPTTSNYRLVRCINSYLYGRVCMQFLRFFIPDSIGAIWLKVDPWTVNECFKSFQKVKKEFFYFLYSDNSMF